MEFYLGLTQIIGVHTILGLSAYVILQTGQVTMAQAGLVSVGAYVAAMLTAMVGWHIIPAMLIGGLAASAVACIVGFPALRIRGLMFVVATLAFGEFVRLFWFNFTFQIDKSGEFFVILVMAVLSWIDRSKAGAVLRAVGEDEVAAQSVGINLTVVKVSAFAVGGFIAGIGGALYAHYTTHIEQENFGILLATFAIAYPLLGGLSNVFGTLIAVIFIQGFIIEVLRFLGDWRNLLYGLLIVVAMNVRPRGLLDDKLSTHIKNIFKSKKRSFPDA